MKGLAGAAALFLILLIAFILGIAATADVEPCWPDCPAESETP